MCLIIDVIFRKQWTLLNRILCLNLEKDYEWFQKETLTFDFELEEGWTLLSGDRESLEQRDAWIVVDYLEELKVEVLLQQTMAAMFKNGERDQNKLSKRQHTTQPNKHFLRQIANS